MSRQKPKIAPTRISSPTFSSFASVTLAAIGVAAIIWGDATRETTVAAIFCFCFATVLSFYTLIAEIGHRIELRLIEMQRAVQESASDVRSTPQPSRQSPHAQPVAAKPRQGLWAFAIFGNSRVSH